MMLSSRPTLQYALGLRNSVIVNHNCATVNLFLDAIVTIVIDINHPVLFRISVTKLTLFGVYAF